MKRYKLSNVSTSSKQKQVDPNNYKHTTNGEETTNGDITPGSSRPTDLTGTEDGCIGAGDEAFGLRRELGLIDGSSIIMGTIIGSGIFISPGGVVWGAGSVGMSFILWLLGGVISFLGALCYAELGTLLPNDSGGDYQYMKKAYANVFGFLVIWLYTLISGPASRGITSMTCANYFLSMFFDASCGPPPALIIKLFAITIVLLLGMVNVMSVKLASKVMVIFTVTKISALIIVITGGVVMLFQGNTDILATGFEGTNNNIGEIAKGLYFGLYAYEGWNALNISIGDLKDVSKNLPRAICISVPTVTAIYLLTNISYFTVLTPDDILSSSAVAFTWSERVMPGFTWVISLAVAMSTFGQLNGAIFVTGRQVYAASSDGNFPTALSMIHIHRYTPGVAIIFNILLTVIMIIPSDVNSLLDLFSFVTWTVTAFVMAGVIILRYRMEDEPRPFKVPIVIPIIMFLVSCFLVIVPLIDNLQIEYIFGMLIILAGLIFYIPFVHYKKVPPFMGSFNKGCQLFFQSAPPENIVKSY